MKRSRSARDVLLAHAAAGSMLALLVGAAGAAAPAEDRSAPGAAAAGPGLSVESERFGEMPDGRRVDRYTLRNAGGLVVRVTNYGATLLTVETPDRDGKLDHVALYLDTLDDYLRGHPLLGSVVGRYANRIAGARFTLDGVEYAIEANAGQHHIHGGRDGFQRLLWDARPTRSDNSVGVEMSLVSPDGHAGYPGTVRAAVAYRLTDANELVMHYTAETDKPTHVNLTNHAYWNLAGAGSGDVLDHVVTIDADHYLPSDAQKIPTGEIRRVDDTPMDFRTPTTIGARIEQVEGKNYDHCYVLNKEPGKRMALAARVVEPKSGRVMEVHTTQPGVQFYTAIHLSDRLGGGGKPYGPYHGFCLETQHYPDAPNRPNFASTVLRPGRRYEEITIHTFSIAEDVAGEGADR